jgi:hypothetical protein
MLLMITSKRGSLESCEKAYHMIFNHFLFMLVIAAIPNETDA